VRILFICTGNMCRSPLAERLTSAWAEHMLGAEATAVHVRSVGTDAVEGREMDRRSARALAELGGSAAGFTSRTLGPGETEDADLVLTMTRRHRHNVLKEAPRALRRTFTLPEAAALLRLVDTTGLEGLPLDGRALGLASLLDGARRVRPASAQDDVSDPIGRPYRVHQDVAAHISESLVPLADVLFRLPRTAPRQTHAPLARA
jgi:protein-tyrosine phosphatase